MLTYFIVDIDECTINSHSCHAEAWCQNTNGSYECACKQGFYGDGYDCVGCKYISTPVTMEINILSAVNMYLLFLW